MLGVLNQMSYLVSQKFLVKISARTFPEELTQTCKVMGLHAHNEGQLCPCQHLHDGVHLNFHLKTEIQQDYEGRFYAYFY